MYHCVIVFHQSILCIFFTYSESYTPTSLAGEAAWTRGCGFSFQPGKVRPQAPHDKQPFSVQFYFSKAKNYQLNTTWGKAPGVVEQSIWTEACGFVLHKQTVIYTVGRVTTDHTVKTHFAASTTGSNANTRGWYICGKGSKHILKWEERSFVCCCTLWNNEKNVKWMSGGGKGRMATAHCSALPVVYSMVERKGLEWVMTNL